MSDIEEFNNITSTCDHILRGEVDDSEIQRAFYLTLTALLSMIVAGSVALIM